MLGLLPENQVVGCATNLVEVRECEDLTQGGVKLELVLREREVLRLDAQIDQRVLAPQGHKFAL